MVVGGVVREGAHDCEECKSFLALLQEVVKGKIFEAFVLQLLPIRGLILASLLHSFLLLHFSGDF
jgi:hypothetical protein